MKSTACRPLRAEATRSRRTDAFDVTRQPRTVGKTAGYEPLPRVTTPACSSDRRRQESLPDILLMQALDRATHHEDENRRRSTRPRPSRTARMLMSPAIFVSSHTDGITDGTTGHRRTPAANPTDDTSTHVRPRAGRITCAGRISAAQRDASTRSLRAVRSYCSRHSPEAVLTCRFAATHHSAQPPRHGCSHTGRKPVSIEASKCIGDPQQELAGRPSRLGARCPRRREDKHVPMIGFGRGPATEELSPPSQLLKGCSTSRPQSVPACP